MNSLGVPADLWPEVVEVVKNAIEVDVVET